MRTIAFATAKGGAGKSTLCASIAVAAEQAGEKVYIIDADPQASLVRWGGQRQADSPGIDRCDPNQLDASLATLRATGYTLAVIDTAGIDSPAAAMAMRAADICLIPARPSALDIQAATPTIRSLHRIDRQFALILNAAPPGRVTTRIDDAAKALSLLGVLALPVIGQRMAFVDSMGLGLGVTEHDPEGKASEEIRQLWKWIFKRMNGAIHG